MFNRLTYIVLFLALATVANAQYLPGKLQGGSGVPGTQSRSPLNSLERAANNLEGVTIVTDTFGNQRFAYYVRVLDTCVNYNPLLSVGNLPVSSFVYQCGSNDSLFYIDWKSDAVLISTGGGLAACDEDWLQISDNSCPDAITDSIYHYRYAAIGARYVWPTAEFLVNDSTATAVQVLSGSRNARQVFYDNNGVKYSTIDQSGATTLWYLEPAGSQFRILTAGGGTPASPSAPFVNQFAVNPPDSTVQMYLYPDTRVDTHTVRNFLYTDPVGKIRSQPIDSLVQIVIDSIAGDTAVLSNWYNSNDTTTNLLRTAFVLRSAWWRGLDTTGFIRFTMRPDGISGPQATLFQDSLVLEKNNTNLRSFIKLRDSGIILSTEQGVAPTSINILTDTINFYDNYYWAQGPPSFTLGDTSFHFWAGNGINTDPGFMTLADIQGPGGGQNWYTSDGTTTDNTRIATVTETATWLSTDILADGVYPFRFEVSGSPENEPEALTIVFDNTEKDSITWSKSDQEIFQSSNTAVVHKSDEYLVFQADSVVIENNSMAEKTQARYIIVGTPNNTTLQKVDADDATSGQFLVSDGTDWVLSSGAAQGYVLQNGNSFGAPMVIGTNDDNSLSFETNGTTRATVSSGATTGGAWTFTNINTNTNSAQNVFTIRSNSTGTPLVGYGTGLLFQGESSTTDNRDMASIVSTWVTATDGSRTSRASINVVNSGGALATGLEINPDYISVQGGSILYGASTITSSSAMTIQGSSTSSAVALRLSANGNNTSASGTIGNSNFTTTSGTKYDWRMSSGFSPTSGTGGFYNLFFNGSINQTGGANGATGAIIFDPTFTAIGSKWSALSFPFSNANALAINQTGANSYSTHVGAFGFGSTTVPTDKVEVTGNVALLTAGNKLKIATGSNASMGTATMVGGTVTVNTTAVSANSIIFLTCNTPGGTQGFLSAPVASITAATSFVINSSSGTDTSTVNWLIIN